jgi:hypothetical protein
LDATDEHLCDLLEPSLGVKHDKVKGQADGTCGFTRSSYKENGDVHGRGSCLSKLRETDDNGDPVDAKPTRLEAASGLEQYGFRMHENL